MKSLLEAVAITMAVFPYAHDCGVAADQLISGYENIGDLPIDEHEALAVRHWAGLYLKVRVPCAQRMTSFACLWGRT
jgi:hypothetical protein